MVMVIARMQQKFLLGPTTSASSSKNYHEADSLLSIVIIDIFSESNYIDVS